MLFFFWNPHTGIFHRYKNRTVPFGGFRFDDRVIGTELDCIVDQVIQNLLDLFHIGMYHQSFRFEMQFDRDHFLAADRLEIGYRIFDRAVDIEVFHMQRPSFGIEFIQRQKALRQLF